MLEKLYHSGVTANNLAAFYETYYYNAGENTTKANTKVISQDTITYYYYLSYKRKVNIKAACSLANIFYKDQNYKSALYFYRKAASIKATPELNYNIAIQYCQLKEYKKAVNYIGKAVPGIKPCYQREARLLLIYICALGGNSTLAREHFTKYIETYPEVDMDLIHVAYVCQEYDYIDRNCLSFASYEQFTLEDAAIVLRVLLMLQKDKLSIYFLQKLMNSPGRVDKEKWVKQCEELYTEVKEDTLKSYLPQIQIEPIMHQKFYWPKAKEMGYSII